VSEQNKWRPVVKRYPRLVAAWMAAEQQTEYQVSSAIKKWRTQRSGLFSGRGDNWGREFSEIVQDVRLFWRVKQAIERDKRDGVVYGRRNPDPETVKATLAALLSAISKT
jgi:hypothetical protein